METKKRLKDTVHLIAYDRAGCQVIEKLLPTRQYNEAAHPILDDDGFRKRCGIVRIAGTIYDEMGLISQQFEVGFDQAGCFVCDAVRFGDGTVAGDWDRVRSASWLKRPTESSGCGLCGVLTISPRSAELRRSVTRLCGSSREPNRKAGVHSL